MANRDIQTALRLLASEINDAPYRITHRKGASDGAYLARKVVNSSWLLGLAAGIQDEVHRIEKAHRADVVKRQNRELFELSEPSHDESCPGPRIPATDARGARQGSHE